VRRPLPDRHRSPGRAEDARLRAWFGLRERLGASPAAAMALWRWVMQTDDHDALVRDELARHSGREVKTTGDGMLATFAGPARAIHCAQAIADSVRAVGIEIRAVLHTAHRLKGVPDEWRLYAASAA